MRVIAGTLRGRRLAAPRGRTTRPTPDRVREALFASLEPLAELRVLDLYAGTGALGIEALSRGARHAVLVEHSRPTLRVLGENLQTLGLEGRARVLARAVERAGAELGRLGPFDLVLADPPYAELDEGRLGPTLRGLLALPGLLAPDGRLVLEHAARTPPPSLEPLALVRTRAYGDTALSLYEPSAHMATESGEV